MAKRPISDMHRDRQGRLKPLSGKGFKDAAVTSATIAVPPTNVAEPKLPYRLPKPAGSVDGEGEP